MSVRPGPSRCRLSIALALATGAAACGFAPNDPMSADWNSTRRSLVAAAGRLDCPEGAIALSPFASATRIARGCGKQVMITCLPPGSFAGMLGQCFPMQDLHRRAAFELDCDPAEVVDAEPLDDAGRVVGVRGCGRRVVYQYVQVGDIYNWVRSGQVP